MQIMDPTPYKTTTLQPESVHDCEIFFTPILKVIFRRLCFRRFSQVQDSLMKVKRVVEEKETKLCLLEGYEERLKSIDTDLQGIKCDMLLINDY